MKTNKWDKRFMGLTHHVSEWSKDKNTKVGAVVVDEDNTILSIGYNGFPRKMNDDVESRHERPIKYLYTEHAERNAIYNAVRSGVCLKGAKIYLTWFPCPDCARAIINSGIKTVVATEPDYDMEKWGDLFKVSYEMLTECGVKIQWYSDENDKWNQEIKLEEKWDYFGWTDLEPSPYSQFTWNTTLLTLIHKVSIQIFMDNKISAANKIRVPAHLCPMLESILKYSDVSYEVISENGNFNNEIIVYYDGIKGRANKSTDFCKIIIENYS